MKKNASGVSVDNRRLIIKCLLMTKLAILLIIVQSMQSFANNGYGQGNISLRLEKTQLKKVFKAIEEGGFYRFVYKDEILPKEQGISIRVQHAELAAVMDKVLENTGLTYHKLSENLVVITRADAGESIRALQAVKITGKVTNDKGEALRGVSVVEKGTNNGTVTGDDGGFTLQVTSPNAILVFSYIGFANQEYPLKGKTSADVRLLASENALKDIVVVGYATQKKVTVTGAVATVKGAELQKSPTVNLSNSLAGRLPGVIAIQSSGEPGYDGSTIQIRGTNTIGNSGAMIVIDGIPDRAGGLDRINSADIESVSILKDASAAIYGVRGANGVILITTKRGKSGVPQLSYDFNHGWAQPTRIPKLMNGPEYAEVNNELSLFNNLPADQWTAGWAAFKSTGSYTRTDNAVVVNAPYSPDYIKKTADGSDPWGHPNTDWFKGALKTWSPQVRHNLQINGGSENVRYLASLGYLDQDGYYKHSATGYKQYDMRLNMDAKINKYINTSIGLTAREENRFYPTQSAGSIFRMLMRGKPTEPEIWPNGLPGPDIENGQNPVVITTNQTGYDKQWKDYFQTNGRVEITNPWIEGLKLTLSGALDKLITRGKKWETPWYLYFWDHATYEPDGKTPLLTKSVRSTFTDPRLSQFDENQLNINLTGLLSYDHTYGPHTINLLAGLSKETVNDDGFNAFRRYFISSAVDQLFAGGSDQQNTGGAGYERARMSYFGRVGYNYKEKYLLEFLWRSDGSYIFPKEKRFGFFPGVLAGWNISNEDFFKAVPLINYLKLRGSYGQLGNDQVYYNGALQEYAFASLYSLGTQVINNQVLKTLSETVVPNDQFTWEVARNSDIGLEGSMMNSKIFFELDYFYNRRNNMLIHPGSVPGSSGISGLLPPVNKGKLENKGFEFKLGYNGQAGEFKYSVSVNGGFAKNKILYWDEASGAPKYQLATGHSYGTSGPNFLAYEYDGVFKDQKDIDTRTLDYSALAGTLRPGDMKFKDIGGPNGGPPDGKIDGNDEKRLDKNRDPTFTGGLVANMAYKGFDLSILFQGASGGLLFFGTESGDIGNFLQYSYDHRWSVDHPSSTDPRLANRGDTYYTGGGAGNNTYFLRNSNYIRLKNIELGYTLGSISKRAGISNLRIYVSGLNLLTWDKMKIWDPESTSGNGQYYPQSRILNTGVRVTF
ncbi:TonB-dependent receptor [Flavitalea sp. BT771]|uniref:TonB-dependent receptor n=1 Tax=Flavitalea sp. BT771 TaxID=3063329 RepID=UPI0026E17264|nr:TonB-dependent receptor [Flavitalea sp. BT771]MDO6431777.1 TonB-dependent receptor [Flavitalea sp. BT771]MDV6220685.1 TonB-dependent receptor [Flavitalea sp. BT771]